MSYPDLADYRKRLSNAAAPGAGRKSLLSMVIIHSLLCVLITLWGIAMTVLGMVWENWTWAVLGIAVCLVGLPFVRNAARLTLLYHE